ncbi:MAG: OHCU decarboxylase [Alteromonadaceae bacterium]|nr:OHCU decarboxylase [Alteromonadaceae bacterium]
MNVNTLNALPWQDAMRWFSQTCAAEKWASVMTDKRPYCDVADMQNHGKAVWETMEKDDLLQAFAAHPMIGDINSLRSKYASTRALAAGEQSGTADADDATLYALKEKNEAYLARHGFIFIICASGLPATTMLEALENRLNNSTEEELKNAAAEQIKITCLRISKAINS